jgi:hypothetical protein
MTSFQDITTLEPGRNVLVPGCNANRDMLEKTRQIFRDKLNPTLFTSTAKQINRACIKSLFEPSSSILMLCIK